ncbi:hypothetical protein K492DRAFT_235516 [Lichtheimia hyalospora FSU 10163]|nr:hypothetical protein K492DRAFT_235516 [Lichtheimia hyalospora FSU 10163]
MLRVSSLIYLQQVWDRHPSEDNNKDASKAISTDTSTTAAIQSFPSPPQTPTVNTATDAAPLLPSPTDSGATEAQQPSSSSTEEIPPSKNKDTTTVSKANTNNDGLSSDHKNKEKENGNRMAESNGFQYPKQQEVNDETGNLKSTSTEIITNDDVVTSSPTDGDSGVGASAGRTMGSYHFYYDNDQEEETEGDNIVSMASNSSGGTTSMPPTPTSFQAHKQQQQQHHLPPPPPPPEEPAEEHKGLRRQASRLTLKRRSLTKKLKKAVSFHKLSNKRDSVVM